MRDLFRPSAIVIGLILLPATSPAAPASVSPVRGTGAALALQSASAWDKVSLDAARLRAEGKLPEAAALIEKFLTANPNVVGARLQLASTHADLAETDPAGRTRHLQNSVTQYQRVLDLTKETGFRYLALWGLVRAHKPEGLDRPAEVEAYARRMIQEDPKRFEGHVELAITLNTQGRHDVAADALRKARQVAPDLPAIHKLQLVQYLVEQVTNSPQLARPAAGKLLDEARDAADDVITSKQDVRVAMMAKSMVLKLQAERAETSPARQKSLIDESDRLYEQARFTNPDGSPIAKTVDDEWREIQGDEFAPPGAGPPKDNSAAYEKFVAAHPDFAPARLALARHHLRVATDIKDRSAKAVETRTRHLELAATHFKQASDVAKEAIDLAMAVDGLITVLGAENLNRAAEAEALARASVKKYPDQPMFVASLLNILLPGTMGAVSDAALTRAREAVPATPEARQMFGMHLWSHAYRNKDLPRDNVRKLLAEAVTNFDAILKQKPDHAEAMMYKGVVLKLQAERVEQDPARIKALLAEAERLQEQAKKLIKSTLQN